MFETLIPAMLAGGAAALLVLGAVGLITWEASYRDLARRVHRIVRMDAAGEIPTAQDVGGIFVATLRRIGEALRATTLYSEQNTADLARTAMAAGLNPKRAVPVVIGGKVLLIVICPILAFTAGILGSYGVGGSVILAAFAAAIALLSPNWALGWVRRSHAMALQRGLPDALDLLVVCAEAGLGLESGIDRIATEMRRSNPAVAHEFNVLGQELRISSERGAALVRMGERTGLESFQRLTGTLAQTLRYGTPLGHALRVLAGEMRNERMVRLEERAARLPVLMTMPMILFILPCLFIVLAGPAAIRVINAMAS